MLSSDLQTFSVIAELSLKFSPLLTKRNYNRVMHTIRLRKVFVMAVNPKSLENLKPGGNRKGAIRVTLTLSPVTVELLKAQGNMSEAVDKLVKLAMLGKIEHDGCLNPVVGSTLDMRHQP
jgi:hypothetical protein